MKISSKKDPWSYFHASKIVDRNVYDYFRFTTPNQARNINVLLQYTHITNKHIVRGGTSRIMGGGHCHLRDSGFYKSNSKTKTTIKIRSCRLVKSTPFYHTEISVSGYYFYCFPNILNMQLCSHQFTNQSGTNIFSVGNKILHLLRNVLTSEGSVFCFAPKR